MNRAQAAAVRSILWRTEAEKKQAEEAAARPPPEPKKSD